MCESKHAQIYYVYDIYLNMKKKTLYNIWAGKVFLEIDLNHKKISNSDYNKTSIVKRDHKVNWREIKWKIQ